VDYRTQNHNKSLMMSHIILVCKYRKQLLVRFGEQVKQLMPSIADEKGFEIMEIEADKDHIHLLARYSPKYSALQLVRLLKQISTFRLWRTNGNYQFLKRHFWKEQTFWSDGYFTCSIGNTSKNTILKYIQNQG
jgi:putative transposase